MIVIVNGTTVVTEKLRCGSITNEGHRCGACANTMGTVEVASIPNGDGAYNTSFIVKCGTHVNKDAGDNARQEIKDDAAEIDSLIDSKASENS